MREINVKDIKENAVKLISDDWALVTAGDLTSWNTMTVSWGGIGELWGKDVVFIFIRPQRYTREFIDREDYFTMSFFEEEYKKALAFCGRNSGRDCDKAKETGLTVCKAESSVGFEQARLTLVCKKLAKFEMNPSGFLAKEIEENYPNKDYHYIYVGEIEKVFEK